ncbi:MAG: fused MFS/spermidine synthase [Planctomycetes bacterium]|nr:fused MFS/spermidine synthase [Planctomycetota bacterium]
MNAIAQTQRKISVVRKAVLPLFLLSGAAGLVYEVTWTRAFGVVFGNTIFAVSTVLTAFMLGMAAGSWLFGRIADRSLRPLRLFALLEIGIGLYAFAFATILTTVDLFYSWFFQSFHPSFYPLSLVRFVTSIIILLIPTALMGGTLPVLSKLWANRPQEKGASDAGIGESTGFLYSINTFGAVAGSFLSGYVFIRIWGVSNTVYLAACANILIGVFSFILSMFTDKPVEKKHKHKRLVRKSKPAKGSSPEGEVITEQAVRKRKIVLAAVLVAGFCALALEVLWTRVLLFVLGTSVYAFACMLTCFILGLALGSFLCSRIFLGRIKNGIFALGIVEFLVGLSVLGSILLLGMLWYIDLILTEKLLAGTFWKEVAAHFIDASVVLLLPTVFMGMVFPIAVKVCAGSWKAAGKRIGEVYACNTMGCVVGSFAAGFVMVPLLGLRDSFLLIVVIQLLLAVVVLFLSEKRRLILCAGAAGISIAAIIFSVLYIPRDIFLQTMNTYHYPSKIIYIKDGATGTITVHDMPDGDRLIVVDGVDVAGMNFMLRTTQKLQGYVPLLMHKDPQKVLQIGYGSGETSGIGLAFGVEDYRIVDVCPSVFEAGRFFETINRSSYKDPRLKKIIMDGKNYVKLTDEKFDIIMNDSTYPGTTGSSALYTYEHFIQCRDKLKDDGILSCWIPLDLRGEDLQLIFKTFQEAMPHSCVWMANNCVNKHAVLVGSKSPLRIDFQRAKKAVEREDIASDLAGINIHSIYDLLDCFIVDEGGLRRIGGAAPLNTDDRPRLEFGAAIKREEEGCLINTMEWFSREYRSVLPYLVNLGDTAEESQQVKSTFEQYYRGTGHALRGLLGMLHGDPLIMNTEFEKAQQANPLERDVQSCLDEMNLEIKALEEAVERTPRKPILRSRLAKRYLLLNNYEAASEQYEKFLELEPENAAGWTNLGFCYKMLGQFEKSIFALNKAIECNDKMVPAYRNLADVYDRVARSHFIQKEYNLALENLEKALALVPKESPAYKYLQERKGAVMRAIEEAKR